MTRPIIGLVTKTRKNIFFVIFVTNLELALVIDHVQQILKISKLIYHVI